MVAGLARLGRRGARDPEGRQIKLLEEEIDHPDQVIRIDPVLEPIREQDRLPACNAFDETRQADPPEPCRS